MTRACSLACAALILAASILANGPLLAETTVTVTGVAPAAGGDTSPVEKRAFEDALAKAYLLSAIRHVPSSSIPALSAGIGAFVTQRAGKT
ncbi:MAG TPA: hypothetical protein PLQ43_05090 [Deltaproteobacteria bacterium]|nr:hypothetical protein [Deltaproteobacteria bacterium]